MANIKHRLVQEKCQQILNELLKNEDNKYCVDCDNKGPRWASWNLGIFLCIRCAGIHRNLGVHISKVKSINLDSWTPEQVSYMQQMGNSKARAVYEANLPDNFRRPQVDSALEAFIRGKYEQKKYIAKEWVPTPPEKPAFDIEEERRKEKEKKKNRTILRVQSNNSPGEIQTNSVPRPHSNLTPTTISVDKLTGDIAKKPSTDLLGLDLVASIESLSTSGDDDFFDAFVSAQPVKSDKIDNGKTGNSVVDEEKEFFNQKVPSEKPSLDKDSILKLYESCNNYVNPLQKPVSQSNFTGQGYMTMPQNAPFWNSAAGSANQINSPNLSFPLPNNPLALNMVTNMAIPQPQIQPVSINYHFIYCNHSAVPRMCKSIIIKLIIIIVRFTRLRQKLNPVYVSI